MIVAKYSRNKFALFFISVCFVLLFFLTRGHCKDSSFNKVELFLNSPLKTRAPSKKSDSEIGRGLVALIDNAVDTIDFAIYGIRNQDEILDVLLKAKLRGVRIRGVVDMDIHNNNYYENTKDFLVRISSVKTDYRSDLNTLKKRKHIKSNKPYWPVPEGYYGPAQCVGYSLKNNRAIISVHVSRAPIEFEGDIMHNKFFVVDGRSVWTGSTNISDTGTGGYNANVACIINDEVVAGFYTREFNQMFEGEKFHSEKKSFIGESRLVDLDVNTKLMCYFSPQDDVLEDALLPLIKKTRKKINIAIFYLTHKQITGELIKAFNRGVEVKIIVDATSAENEYTKHEILRAVGIPVKVENWGGKMHMKVATFDDKYLFLGSMNWTSAGVGANDENSLVIMDEDCVHRVNKFFNELWESIPDVFLIKNPPPESIYSINSLEDGIDNDYDGLIDSEDDPDPTPVVLPPYRIVPKESGYDLIKGIVNKNGFRIYVLPNDKYYSSYKVNRSNEGWFPSIEEAVEAGFEAFNYSKHILNEK